MNPAEYISSNVGYSISDKLFDNAKGFDRSEESYPHLAGRMVTNMLDQAGVVIRDSAGGVANGVFGGLAHIADLCSGNGKIKMFADNKKALNTFIALPGHYLTCGLKMINPDAITTREEKAQQQSLKSMVFEGVRNTPNALAKKVGLVGGDEDTTFAGNVTSKVNEKLTAWEPSAKNTKLARLGNHVAFRAIAVIGLAFTAVARVMDTVVTALPATLMAAVQRGGNTGKNIDAVEALNLLQVIDDVSLAATRIVYADASITK